MAIERAKLAHIWERDPFDWYVEPIECSLALISRIKISGSVWDPACGRGNILEACRLSSIDAYGSDIVCRASLCERVGDFMDETFFPFSFKNIISNPPFGIAEKFVRRAIEITPQGGIIAMILPLVWMAGFSSKRDWLPRSPLKTIFPISPRPSMPPGKVIEAGLRPGNGTKDFAWFLWEVGHRGVATVEFLNTKPHSLGNLSKRRGGGVSSTQQRLLFDRS